MMIVIKKIDVNIVESIQFYNFHANANKLAIVLKLAKKRIGDIMLEHVMLNFKKIINNLNLILLKNLEED